jgi:hypothetical protein
MPQYLIERDLPGAGKLSPEELKAISQKSCGVLDQLGSRIQWVHSYVTDDKIYCIYRAPQDSVAAELAFEDPTQAIQILMMRTPHGVMPSQSSGGLRNRDRV